MRWLLGSIIVLLCSLPLYAVNERAFGFCEDGGQTVNTQGLVSTTTVQQSYPSCTVTVYNNGTLTKSTIYSDQSNTPLSNPFTAASDGSWFFYAADGRYDVQFSNGGIPSPFTRADWLLNTGVGAGGITGSGTATFVPVFTSSSAIGNSSIKDDGSLQITVGNGYTGTFLNVGDGSHGGTYELNFNMSGSQQRSWHTNANGGIPLIYSSDSGTAGLREDDTSGFLFKEGTGCLSSSTYGAICSHTDHHMYFNLNGGSDVRAITATEFPQASNTAQLLISNGGGYTWSAQPITSTGDATISLNSSGQISSTVTAVNSGSIPLSSFVITNGSGQFIASTGTNGQCWIFSGGTAQWGSCTGQLAEQLVGTPNVITVTKNGNTNAIQNLQTGCASSPCFQAGVLNSLGKTIRLRMTGSANSFSTTAQTIQISIGLDGTHTAFINNLQTTSTVGASWTITAQCTVTTTGSSGVMLCATLTGGQDDASPAVSQDYSQATSLAVNLTGTLTPQWGIAFGSASTSNSFSGVYASTEQLN